MDAVHGDGEWSGIADDGAVQTHRERFAFWPFTAGELLADLRAVGLQPASAEQPTVVAGRYGVTARRPG